MRITITVVFFSLFLFSCYKKENSGIQQFDWLIGTWENRSAQNIVYETWIKANDSLLVGKSFSILKNDTSVFENITIEKRGNEIFYIPVVKDQNQGKPVRFKLISNQNNIQVFENTLHDFPQRIIYAQINPDSLKATIEGIIEDQYRQTDFYMSKIKGE